MPLTHQQAVCFLRYNFTNILCSLTNCISVPASPVPLPVLLPALSSIAILMAVVVPASASVPAPVSLFSSSSSSSLSSCELSVAGLQPDSPPDLFQPLPSPPPPAFSAACRALQAAYRVQRRKQ